MMMKGWSITFVTLSTGSGRPPIDIANSRIWRRPLPPPKQLTKRPMSGSINLNAARPRRAQRLNGSKWLKHCLRDERGCIVANLANVLIAMRLAPELVNVLAFDEMLGVPLLLAALPLAPGADVPVCPATLRELRDEDVSQLQEYLQHHRMAKVGKDTAHQAVDQRARERAFHPVRNYLEELRWDGVRRLDHWMSDMLGADPTIYTSRIGRMFIIAMVAASSFLAARAIIWSCSRASRPGNQAPAVFLPANGSPTASRTFVTKTERSIFVENRSLKSRSWPRLVRPNPIRFVSAS
jgi:hypothetical protein